MIRCTCPECKASMELPDHLGNSSFACVNCTHLFVVPGSQNSSDVQQSFMDRLLQGADAPGGRIVPAPPPTRRTEELPPPASAIQKQDQPTASVPRSAEPRAQVPRASVPRSPEPSPRWMDEDRPRRPRDYYDDDLEDDFDRPRRSAYTRESAARAAMVGMITSTIGLIGILAGIFVFMLSSRRGPQPGLQNLTIFLLAAALISFVFSLFGIVFSSRGLDRVNERNRGAAVGGLVCGILGLALSVVFGSFYFLCGVFLRLLPF